MLCKLVQSIRRAINQSFSLRKVFWSELHIFFKKFQMTYLRTVTSILVSHVLPQLQLFRTQKNPQNLTLKKVGTAKILTKKVPKHSAESSMWRMTAEMEEPLFFEGKRVLNLTQQFKIYIRSSGVICAVFYLFVTKFWINWAGGITHSSLLGIDIKLFLPWDIRGNRQSNVKANNYSSKEIIIGEILRSKIICIPCIFHKLGVQFWSSYAFWRIWNET